jgi:hypothetical protein
MPSPAFPNTIISNAYIGTDQVSKILLGSKHVWPLAPIFSFDTYQSGGELNFDVASDTGIIATVVNGNESTLHPNPRSINLIQAKAASSSYNESYTTPPDTQLTNINLPLYSRREVNITGRGTQVTRYNADYNNGSVNVTISNDFSEAVTFSVNINGVTKTKTITGQSYADISYTGLSKGSKTITITNVTDNTSEQISVNINTNYTPLTPTYYRFGAQDNSPTVSNKLTKVDVYALTEAEALASNDSFRAGTRPAVILVNNFRWTSQESYYFHQMNYAVHLYYTLNLIDKGSGYEKNATITSHTNINHSGFWGSLINLEIRLRTNDKGEVIDYSTLLTSNTFKHWTGEGTTEGNALWAEWGNGSNFKNWWPTVKWSGYSSGTINCYSLIGPVPSYNLNMNAARAVTGEYTLQNLAPPPLATSKPAENLLFNNTDITGRLYSADLKNINVNSIVSQSQRELQLIRTDSINTSYDIRSHKPDILKVYASPKLHTIHGSGITYDYI